MKTTRKSTPNSFFYWSVYYPIKLISRNRKKVIIHNHLTNEITGPVLILANHVSFWDFAYVSQAFSHHRLTVISNRYYFRPKQLRFLLRELKAIPKSIMYSDLETIKLTFQAVKENRFIVMFPEGRLSTDGSNLPIVKGTGALVKKMNVPLVFVEISGGYLTTPKWGTYSRSGTIDVDIKKYCSPTEYASLSATEVDDLITENIRHDEYEFSQRSGYRYFGKDLTKGLDGILYHCPKCHEEFTLLARDNHITCSVCGYDAELLPDYTFRSELPEIENIRAWNQTQIEHERSVYLQNFTPLQIPVRVKKMNMLNPKLDETGEGTVTIDSKGYAFSGTINQLPESIFIAKNQLEGIPFSSNEEFEFYHDRSLYYFYPLENPQICAKISIIADIIHKSQGDSIEKQ